MAKTSKVNAPIPQPIKLFDLAKSPRAESLGFWLRIWGLSGKLLADGRHHYFDVATPLHWTERRRRQFSKRLKQMTG
jgi:hypothetical protein